MAFKAVLFDWRGTLFYDEPDNFWLRNSAATIGRALDNAELAKLSRGLESAASDPDVIAAQATADLSVANHDAATMLHLLRAGFDHELADAVRLHDGAISASFPYPDTATVLQELKSKGIRVAVISDIHFELQPHFEAHKLADFVDSYALSFKMGMQKPDPRFFQAALESLGVNASEALMVGDRASRDAGRRFSWNSNVDTASRTARVS